MTSGRVRLGFIACVVAAAAGCGSSATGPAGHVAIAGTVFSATVRQGENETLNFEVTNTGSTTIHFESNMCPGTLEVFDAQGKQVYDARNFTTVCAAFSAPRTLAPGEKYQWQEGWPGVLIASHGAPQTIPPVGTYTMRAGPWFWSRFGAVDSQVLTVAVIP